MAREADMPLLAQAKSGAQDAVGVAPLGEAEATRDRVDGLVNRSMVRDAVKEEELCEAEPQVTGEVRVGLTAREVGEDGAQGRAPSDLCADEAAQESGVSIVKADSAGGGPNTS